MRRQIDVHIVESGEELGGLGEPSTPPLAAAVSQRSVYPDGPESQGSLPLKNHDFSRSHTYRAGLDSS